MTNAALPGAESESERLLVQTSLVHWLFFFHSAHESFSTIHRAPVVPRATGRKRIHGLVFLSFHGPKENPNGWSCKLRWPTGRFSVTRPTNLLASSTERCRPVDPRVPSLPSKLSPVLLRGIGAASCRSGGFWVTNGLLPRAESESERLVAQTVLVHWSFFFHSAHESSNIIHRALPSS